MGLTLPCHRHMARVRRRDLGGRAFGTGRFGPFIGMGKLQVSELFDEVNEEVRRDQLKKLWDQYSIYIIAGALLIIAAVGGWRGYQYLEAQKAAEAGAAFDKAVELSEHNKHAEAEAAFNDLGAKAPWGYRMLARMRAAAEAPFKAGGAKAHGGYRRRAGRRAGGGAAPRDPKAAAKMYDDIAADR